MNVTRNDQGSPCEHAFTFVELIVVLSVIAFCALMVLPALARTRTNSSMAQCQNNLKQLASAWTMYSADNKGWLVSAYPIFGDFTASWCGGNAQTGGQSSYYDQGGADPKGITNGLIWPYTKSLGPYKCPSDKRVADSSSSSVFRGKPILRSVSMNSFMAGLGFGVTPQFTITSPNGPRNANAPVFLKENEISRPSGIFVIAEEDHASINDAMLIVDMGGSRGLLELPSRLHRNGYGANFADGHTEYIRLTDATSLNWMPGQFSVINNDWRRLTNMTTAPLH